MTRVKETIARHDKGYNCAQSVACTYADLVGLDEATMFKVTEGLGKGMGGTLATCVLAGMKRSTGNLEAPDSKLETYKLAEEIVNKFQEQCHSLVCKELKGLDTGKVLTPCPDCIMNAARIAEEVLDLKA